MKLSHANPHPRQRTTVSPAHWLTLATLLVAFTASPATAQRPDEPSGHLRLEATFPGPFPGTVVQRVFDPDTGAVCYFYLPEHVVPDEEDEQVDFGASTIGTMSCIPPPMGIRR